VHDAIRIVAATELAGALVAMVEGRDEARAMGERGRAVFEAQAGATARTVRALMDLAVNRGEAGERAVRGR
jgi:3-deoxy-D-manno-octulosonic-acid transferase